MIVFYNTQSPWRLNSVNFNFLMSMLFYEKLRNSYFSLQFSCFWAKKRQIRTLKILEIQPRIKRNWLFNFRLCYPLMMRWIRSWAKLKNSEWLIKLILFLPRIMVIILDNLVWSRWIFNINKFYFRWFENRLF